MNKKRTVFSNRFKLVLKLYEQFGWLGHYVWVNNIWGYTGPGKQTARVFRNIRKFWFGNPCTKISIRVIHINRRW